MRRLDWRLAPLASRGGESEKWIPAVVPGAVQADYARAEGWGDLNYSLNSEAYRPLEDLFWLYRAEIALTPEERGKRVFFCAKGIDYQYEISLNGETLYRHEGMFAPVELELTGRLRGEDVLEVLVYPVPKDSGAEPGTREEARASFKSAVGYGWDWHPRLVPLGIWDEAGLECRESAFLREGELRYTLAEDYSAAEVEFLALPEGDGELFYALFDPEGCPVYRGRSPFFRLQRPRLWWCSGQGEQALYRWQITLEKDGQMIDCKTGRVGFRRVRLVTNEGAWWEEKTFPKTRCSPPATIELNGRRIFVKGTNWVHPEIFHGLLTREIYEPLVTLAKEAHFNLFRVWGGGIVNKECWFDLCDEMGLLVWQEFMLACNAYVDSHAYLSVVEEETTAIVRRVRQHPCLALWGGGNELFNSWSLMNDQAPVLRLLNKLTYELDPGTPFIPTSPLMGMGHGCYTFVYPDGREVYQAMAESRFTAYTEFGVPSLAPMENLRRAIPPEELFPVKPTAAWVHHHAFGAWDGDTWLCPETLTRYFGEADSLEALVNQTNWLQCEGYKTIYEEARRQAPYCGMAVNWDWCEPWVCAANNSLIAYPCIPKPAYYAVGEACRPTLPSLALPKFSYAPGETFTVTLWLLHDAPEAFPGGELTVRLVTGGQSRRLGVWEVPETPGNVRCGELSVTLPEDGAEDFTLEAEIGGLLSRYRLRLQ